MDKLNKLRLLAGIGIDPKTMVTPKKQYISEAYVVPQSKQALVPKTEQTMKLRATKASEAYDHLTAALKSISEIPAVDYAGDLAHYANELQELISADGGQAGFKNLVQLAHSDYRKWKRSENSRVKMEQEEEKFVAGAEDAIAHHSSLEDRAGGAKFEKGQKVTHLDEPMVVVVANANGDYVGVTPVGEEDNIDALKLVHTTELTPSDDIKDPMAFADNSADADAISFGADGALELDADEEDPTANLEQDDDLEDDEFPVKISMKESADVKELKKQLAAINRSKVSLERKGIFYDNGQAFKKLDDQAKELQAKIDQCKKKLSETTNYYYDTKDGDDPEDLSNVAKPTDKDSVYKAVKMKDDKNENPMQLNALGAASMGEHEKKVRVPADVKKALKDAIDDVEKQFVRLGSTESDAKFFYKNLVSAYSELLQHIEGGTVHDIKQAQIFMTTLMGPILHKIPAIVVNFVAKGGAAPSLKDYMKPVDSKYPITGPRQTLK